MPRFLLSVAGVAALALTPGMAAQAAPPSGPVAALHQFIDNFNKGDVKAAEAAHASDAVIIDEMPPHVWRGPNAFQAWTTSLGEAAKAAGDTEQKVTLGAPIRTEINGDKAYAVVPATLTYKEKGKPMTERAQMVATMRKDGPAWKLTGWAWAGTVPRTSTAKSK